LVALALHKKSDFKNDSLRKAIFQAKKNMKNDDSDSKDDEYEESDS